MSDAAPLARYGSVRVHERQAVRSVTELLPRLASLTAMHLEGRDVVLAGVDRLQCFLHHGSRCARCGLEATFFALERVESRGFSGWTLNLYGRREGRDVYFTKDHVIPRLHGGPDELSNYQTLCWPCNSRKGSSLE